MPHARVRTCSASSRLRGDAQAGRGGVDQRLEEAAVRERLGVPLDAEREAAAALDRLDRPVRGARGDGQAAAETADGLVVEGVDGVRSRADQRGEAGAVEHADVM